MDGTPPSWLAWFAVALPVSVVCEATGGGEGRDGGQPLGRQRKRTCARKPRGRASRRLPTRLPLAALPPSLAPPPGNLVCWAALLAVYQPGRAIAEVRPIKPNTDPINGTQVGEGRGKEGGRKGEGGLPGRGEEDRAVGWPPAPPSPLPLQVYIVVVSLLTVAAWCANTFLQRWDQGGGGCGLRRARPRASLCASGLCNCARALPHEGLCACGDAVPCRAGLSRYTGEMGVVAVVPLVAFFGFDVLDKDDFNSFLWNVVMLAMGGLALGAARRRERAAQAGGGRHPPPSRQPPPIPPPPLPCPPVCRPGEAVKSSGLLAALALDISRLVTGLTLWQVALIFSGLVRPGGRGGRLSPRPPAAGLPACRGPLG
jgi:phosphate transporter